MNTAVNGLVLMSTFALSACLQTLPQQVLSAAPAVAPVPLHSSPSSLPEPPRAAPVVPRQVPSYDVLYADKKCAELKAAHQDQAQREKWLLEERAESMNPSQGGMGSGGMAAAAGLGLMTGGIGLLAMPFLESAIAQGTSQLKGQEFDNRLGEIKAHQKSIGKYAKSKRCRL